MVETGHAENTRIKPRDGDGLSEKTREWLARMVGSAMSQIVHEDSRHRPVHFLLMTLTLEGSHPIHGDIVTTDTVTSMTVEHMHEALRDWLRKETQ